VTPALPGVVMGATAVELVHLGSLYHDDVMDEAETGGGSAASTPAGATWSPSWRAIPARPGVRGRRLPRHRGGGAPRRHHRPPLHRAGARGAHASTAPAPKPPISRRSPTRRGRSWRPAAASEASPQGCHARASTRSRPMASSSAWSSRSRRHPRRGRDRRAARQARRQRSGRGCLHTAGHPGSHRFRRRDDLAALLGGPIDRDTADRARSLIRSNGVVRPPGCRPSVREGSSGRARRLPDSPVMGALRGVGNHLIDTIPA